jgi:cytochrome c oxidase subunit 2
VILPLALALSAPLAAADAAVKTFEITASRFEFQPDRIEVAEGDQVRLTLRSADTTHGIAIPELKVKVKIPKGGATVTAEFVAAKAGTFVIKCSEYCGPGHKQMLGTLVVTARGGGQ